MAQPSSEPPVARVIEFTVEGQPYSKARPRVTGKGTYTPKVQRINAEALAWEFRLAVKEPFLANVEIELTFYRGNRQRIDLDNLTKQVLDAANTIAWNDDSQVTSILARLHYDGERPRTIIVIREDPLSTMRRGDDALTQAACERCGADFTYHAYPSHAHCKPRFCSKTCQKRAPCEECGTIYHKRNARQRFCSRPCVSKSTLTREKIARAARRRGKPLPCCGDCGARLHRHGAVLCRTCWRKSPYKRRKSQLQPTYK
jgi:Holliday junction resolvase RusA-like endonuclease